MTLEQIMTSFGYPALAVGVALEGETVVLVAGYLAHNGHFRLPLVILIAWGGAFASDQFWFAVGRREGATFLAKRPRWASQADRVRRFLVRYRFVAVIGYRFLYGMRTVTPVVIGASGFAPRRFFLLNLLGTCLWGASVAVVGYYFGNALELFVTDAKRFELPAVAAILLLACVAWVWRLRRRG